MIHLSTVNERMATTRSTPENYRTTASNGRVEIVLDAPIAKGGAGAGFGPHELLEASLAACLNMAVRMHAQAHGITLADVRTTVNIIRPDGNTLRFDQNIHLIGDLSSAERAALLEAAANCPVRQSLSRRLEFSGIDLEPCAACP